MHTTRDEFAFIDWLRQRTPMDSRVLIGPGDDAAALRVGANGTSLVTTDMLMDGIDFRLTEVGARLVGRKALAVNLSDMAAMAGRPVAALISVALPRNGGRTIAEEIYLGVRQLADEYETAIIGGDTNSWDGPLVISVTLMGEPTGRGPVQRSGARPGDWLCVTGPVGGSICGKHLTFTPRVREAIQLHEAVELHAMINISDGLAADIFHICRESRCGAVVRAESIPISGETQFLSDGVPPLEHALGDGEDFELAFAVSPEDGRRLIETQPINGLQLVAIGECVDDGLWLEENCVRRALEPRGYVHSLG